MKSLTGNHFDSALEGLRSNRLRTGLTIIGVLIGVASITATLSLTSGASDLLGQQVKNTKDTVAIIRSGDKVDSSQTILGQGQQLGSVYTLSIKDARQISRLPNVSAAPLSVLRTKVSTSGSDNKLSAAVVGSTSDLQTIADLEIKDGQFIDATKGAVLGNQLAIDLFGTEHALGSILKVRGQIIPVVGVLKPVKNPINYVGFNADYAAIMPIDVSKQFTDDAAQIQQIVLTAKKSEDLKKGIDKAKAILDKNHAGDADYQIITGKAVTAPNSESIRALFETMIIIAGISLLVGGIGIMNIMLVSVAERQREVGIRRAVGATHGHIINQFLIESAIIGIVGGIAGYIVGIVGAFAASSYLPFTPVIEWQIAALALGISLITGIVFGIYPAIRATKKHPIESLR